MKNCAICRCPLIRLLNKYGKLEPRITCARCTSEKVKLKVEPRCQPQPTQSKKKLLLDNPLVVKAARRAYYRRTKKDCPTAADS